MFTGYSRHHVMERNPDAILLGLITHSRYLGPTETLHRKPKSRDKGEMAQE